MYGGIAWVVFAFLGGLVLLSMPRQTQEYAQRDSSAEVYPSRSKMMRGEFDNTAKTMVSVEGTPGSEGTLTTEVKIPKKTR